MTFLEFFKETFISPFVSRSQNQTAFNTGPDQGMTSGDQQNTFPSKMQQIDVKLPAKKKTKKQKKKV
jgi:hypothetical protein